MASFTASHTSCTRSTRRLARQAVYLLLALLGSGAFTSTAFAQLLVEGKGFERLIQTHHVLIRLVHKNPESF